MNILPWISDEDFMEAAQVFMDSSTAASEESKGRIEKNIVDPFSSLMIASTLDLKTSKDLIDAQSRASALSGISNALGVFHQSVLGAVDGWEDHDSGYDLESVKHQILAEIKNKHNTLNSGGRAKTVESLDTAVQQKKGEWTGYLVIIIPKRAQRYEKKIVTAQRPVYEIDGASFYTKVTGHEKALHDLFNALMELLVTLERPLPGDIEGYCRLKLSENLPK